MSTVWSRLRTLWQRGPEPAVYGPPLHDFVDGVCVACGLHVSHKPARDEMGECYPCGKCGQCDICKLTGVGA